MDLPASHEVTKLLRAARDGEDTARDALFSRVYDELRRLAANQLRGPRADRSWQPTELVNEAFLRMVGPQQLDLADRAHFFAVAVTVMRRVLVDHHRRRSAEKRGGAGDRVTLDDPAATRPSQDVDVVELDAALEELTALDERKARIVELRFFGGLSVAEVADVLGVSKRTVESDWFFARAWLQSRLEGSGD